VAKERGEEVAKSLIGLEGQSKSLRELVKAGNLFYWKDSLTWARHVIGNNKSRTGNPTER